MSSALPQSDSKPVIRPVPEVTPDLPKTLPPGPGGTPNPSLGFFEKPTITQTPLAALESMPQPRLFGKYRLLAKIAQGGMGVVFKAQDTVLDRIVALKMIRSGILATDEEVERFSREARAIANLKHPNIIKIHDFGQHQGHHFFTMDLAESGNLYKHLGRFRENRRSAVTLLMKVARAIQHIHENGLLHRDLKPGNILLEPEDEPLISDFGLAKRVDEASDLTRVGDAPGTPAYMAPEQTRGQNDLIGSHSDVWALGVILFELLCGRRPFHGDNREQTIEAIQESDPANPRTLEPRLPRDLEVILLKCLEKAPERRYPSAGALADDLGCWLRGEPIKARLPRWPSRVWRRVRRHPRLALTALLLLAATVAYPLSAPYLDPDRALHYGIVPKLKNNQAVTLLGPRGTPAWMHWQVPGTIGEPGPEGTFTIHTGSLSLLEMLRDPHMESFRFSAEIRHQFGSNGKVGLYLGHETHQVPLGKAHSFMTLDFADHGREAQLYNGQNGQPLSKVEMELVHYCEPALVESIRHRKSLGIHKEFQPLVVTKKSDWRKVVIEVTPASIRAKWDNELIGELPAAKKLDSATSMLFNSRIMVGPKPTYPHRAGLGLYVYKSAASFRNVVVEPLEK